MSKWVGFIDLLALRHAASIDRFAVEKLLNDFFEVLTTYARHFDPSDLTVDILSDSAVLRFSRFEIMCQFYLKIRPEMFFRHTFFRMGACAGDVDITRFSLSKSKNVAGTYFKGDPGLIAFAAQNALNGAGANIVVPDRKIQKNDDSKDELLQDKFDNTSEHHEFDTAITGNHIVKSLYLQRDARPVPIAYFDFSMTNREIGSNINIESDRTIDQVYAGHSSNSGFLFFDEIYREYIYTKTLSKYDSRKYLNVLFTIIESINFDDTTLSADGSEVTSAPPILCRLFIDNHTKFPDKDDEFSMVAIRCLSRLLDSKLNESKYSQITANVLDRCAELEWVCGLLSKRHSLRKKLGQMPASIISMRNKDLILRSMSKLGYSIQ